MKNTQELEDLFVSETSSRSKLDLFIEVLRLRSEKRVLKAQSTWLDMLADDLRENDDFTESDNAHCEYKEVKQRERKRLTSLGL